MTQVAKEHGLSYFSLVRLLNHLRVIFCQSGQWMLYADYAGHELTRNRTHSCYDLQGRHYTTSYLVWTEKGRMFVDGILRHRLMPKDALVLVEQQAPEPVETVVQVEVSF